MKKNTKVVTILFTMLIIVILGYNLINIDKSFIWIKKDVISNIENAEYIRANVETLMTFNQETKKMLALSEIDNVNNRFQMYTFANMDDKEYRHEYYRDGNMIYKKDFNGTWQIEEIDTDPELGKTNELVNRLKSIYKMTYIKTEKLNYVDSYVFISSVPRKEAQGLIDGLFNDVFVGSSNNFIIKSAQTEWWINKESKQLAMEIRTVNAEIDGYPLQVIIKTSYADYNIPLEIKMPENITQ
jgi:hypothetical protein